MKMAHHGKPHPSSLALGKRGNLGPIQAQNFFKKIINNNNNGNIFIVFLKYCKRFYRLKF